MESKVPFTQEVWLKLAKWFCRRRFLNFVSVFSLICNYRPLEKDRALYFPFTQGYFVPSLVELAQWFWRRRFLNFVNVFLLFCNYLPLEKGVALYLNKLESPSPKDALCQVWLKLASWFLRRRWKCEKFLNGWTDKRQKTGDQTSSLEPKLDPC